MVTNKNEAVSHEPEIHRVKSSGMVFYEDMIAGIDAITVLLQNRRRFLILDDARESVPRFSIREMKLIVHYMRDKLPTNCTVRHAVIHSDLMGTAYALIASRMGISEYYSVGVFSTEESALAWLKS